MSNRNLLTPKNRIIGFRVQMQEYKVKSRIWIFGLPPLRHSLGSLRGFPYMRYLYGAAVILIKTKVTESKWTVGGVCSGLLKKELKFIEENRLS